MTSCKLVTFGLKSFLSALMGEYQEMIEDGHFLELPSATNKCILEDKSSKFLILWEKQLWEVSQTLSKGAQWSWLPDPWRNNLFFNMYHTILACFHSLPCFPIPYWYFLGSSYRKLSYIQILIFGLTSGKKQFRYHWSRDYELRP